ncbi:sacsin-like, partial [Mizuhopecten yessoensis]|uniref:sacsin-like n=1 Tax=Mizuhopecten yessoensis TaxID=6573 RepID=UPI000B45D2A2
MDYRLCNRHFKKSEDLKTECSSELQHMQKAFLTTIVEENPRVFKRHDIWAKYDDCRFMDPELIESDVGDIAFKAAIHFLETEENDNTKVMRLQKKLDATFSNAGLETTIKTKIFSIDHFFTEVLFPEMLSDFWQSKERNMLVMFAVDNTSETTKNLLSSTKCIPSKPTGEMKYPHELIHPDSELENLFATCEGRFVHEEMIEAGIRNRKKQLADIGMIVETLPSHLVVDRVESVLGLSRECDKCAIDRSVTIIQYIQTKCMSEVSLIKQLKDIPYLPILKKPQDWTFRWGADCQSFNNGLTTMKEVKVANCNHEIKEIKENVQFAKPKCLYLTSSQHLVGPQELVMDVSCYKTLVSPGRDLFSRLGVNGVDTIPIKVVCRHLIQLCETTDPVTMVENTKQLLKTICNEVYSFLSKRISNETISETEMSYITNLKEHPVVFCHNVFVKPKQTALSILTDCEPHLFGLQTHHLGSKCKHLLRVLDIKSKFTTDDILNVMLEKQTCKGEEQLTEDELELYTKLIKVLVKCMEREEMDYHGICAITDDEGVLTQLCIPDVKGVLTPINELCLNDNKKIKTTGTMKFVNGKIGPDFARTLGVKAKTKQHFSDNTKRLPFGQKEELTTRIKDILRGYPCDEGIMKELLQNADDAQATELQFIIDDNTYSDERVFDDKWKVLQGPALLVYNDSMLSAKDIQGIQDLGIGSQGDDPTKTGQYGVGFNAVYHLTDAPSFLTKGPKVEGGETMCVMDPHCQFLSDATDERPGIQLMNLDEHRYLYPDVFKCFHEDKLLTSKGTVFRFPLRADDKTRKHLADSMPPEKLRNLLKTFERDLLEALLFVNSVKKISLSDISAGEFKPLYEVEIIISKANEEKRTAFGNHLRDMSKNFRDTQDLLSIQNKSVSYNITVKDSNGVSNKWLVVQQVGFGDGDIPEEINDAYTNENLGLLPRGGVAIRLKPHTSSEQRHKAFCFLPLPVDTGLPVHINGHFALGGEARSSLWNKERRTYKWEWNKLLLSRVIPSAYIASMQRIKQMLLSDLGESGLVTKTRQLDDVFPIYKDAKDDNWKLLAKEVLNQIYNGGHQLFYLYKSHKSSASAKLPSVFMPLKEPKEEFPAVFNTLKYHKKKTQERLTWEDQKRLAQVMKDIGLRLLDSPKQRFQSLKDAEVPVSEISPKTIMGFMKSFSRRDIEHRCNILIQEDGTHLSSTSLLNLVKVSALLQYCRDSEDFASSIVDVPLCLTQDRKLRVFKEGSEIFCNEMFSILPGSGSQFLHQRLVSLCNIEKLQENVFKSFDIPSFANYLAESLPPKIFRNPKEMVTFLPDNKRIPNSSWICDVWKFFARRLKKCKGKDKADGTFPDDSEAVQTIPQDLMVVAQWNV